MSDQESKIRMLTVMSLSFILTVFLYINAVAAVMMLITYTKLCVDGNILWMDTLNLNEQKLCWTFFLLKSSNGYAYD